MSGAAESSNKEETLGISANEPLNETEAAERFEAAANKLLGVANENSRSSPERQERNPSRSR